MLKKILFFCIIYFFHVSAIQARNPSLVIGENFAKSFYDAVEFSLDGPHILDQTSINDLEELIEGLSTTNNHYQTSQKDVLNNILHEGLSGLGNPDTKPNQIIRSMLSFNLIQLQAMTDQEKSNAKLFFCLMDYNKK